MFGLLIPSRPILPEPSQTHSQTQCSFTVPATPPFSHLAVFMHPGQTLPPDTLAAIYIQLPPSQGFTYLGALGPDKQSAMYKVNAGKGQAQANGSIEGVPDVKEEVMVDDATAQPVATGAGQNIVVGISLEPAAQVRAQMAEVRAQMAERSQEQGQLTTRGAFVTAQNGASNGDMVKGLAQKIGQNAFNFLSGFAETGADGKEVVPTKAFQDWWTKFEKKVQLDPTFLMRDGDG